MQGQGARGTVKLQHALLQCSCSKTHDTPLTHTLPFAHARDMWIVFSRRAFVYAELRVGQDSRDGRLHAREPAVLETLWDVDAEVGKRQRRFHCEVDDTLEAVPPFHHARPGGELHERLKGVFASRKEGSSKRVCQRVICVLTVLTQRWAHLCVCVCVCVFVYTYIYNSYIKYYL